MTPVLSQPVVCCAECRCDRPDHKLPRHKRRLVADADAVDMVTCALSCVLADSEPHVPVVVAATGYGAYAADVFVQKVRDTARSMRPSDSIALEASGLLAGFIAATGGTSRSAVILSPDCAAEQALCWARSVVASGQAPSVAICEVTQDSETGFFATAARVWPNEKDVPCKTFGSCSSGTLSNQHSVLCTVFESGYDGESAPRVCRLPMRRNS